MSAARDGSPACADAAWRALHAAATAPYRRVGRFAWHFARGKLGRDPVFRALLERGDLAGRARVVDIGCGQGLLASLLRACGAMQRAGSWPAAWPAAPEMTAYTGIELMPRDVARAERALVTAAARAERALVTAAAAHDESHPPPQASEARRPEPHFICGDMCSTPLPPCDAVVILDVLHYVPPAAQTELLARVHAALRPHGRLLLRVGDAADDRPFAPFAISQWVDRLVTWTRGHRAAPTWGRPLAGWQALLHSLGFAPVRSVPMSQGTPFANVLLVADVATCTCTCTCTGTGTGTDTPTLRQGHA